MKKAKGLGKKVAHLNKDEAEQFRALQEKVLLSEIESAKEQSSLKLRIKTEEEKNTLGELRQMGNIPQSMVMDSLFRAIWLIPFLIIAILGEYAFSVWMIKYFGLGVIETYLVSATIVIVSLKVFDFYFTALRQKFRDAESTIFLIASAIGVVSVFLLIFFGALIRKDLSIVTTNPTLHGTFEETIRQANHFYQKNAPNYVWLMVALTVAFTIVGGISYHEIKNRFLHSIGYLLLYRKLKKIRRNIEFHGEQISLQAQRLERYRAEFDDGLIMERKRLAEKQSKNAGNPNHQGKIQKTGPLIFNPFTLLIIALLLFFLFKGKAFGAEHIILLDISKSIEVKNYSGAETEFEKNKNVIEAYVRDSIDPGDRFQVIGITEDSFSRPYILLDAVVSKDKGAFGEGLASEKLTLLKRWKQLDLKANAKATDIFGAVSYTAISFSPTEPKKFLIILSDMRHCTHGFDLETPAKINIEQVLKKIKASRLVPQLKGVDVKCLGVHSSAKTPAYWMSLKDFWTKYFTMAHAKLKIFSTERRF